MKAAKRKARLKKTRKQRVALMSTLAAVAVFTFAGAGAIWLSAPSSTLAEEADVAVYKTTWCQCCEGWVEHLREHGLDVETVSVSNTSAVKAQLGVPESVGACHTAKAGDYWVEGHVPADLVAKLLHERPEDIRGIAVPGMPVGSPGMEGANPQPYSLLAVDAAGNVETYANRQGKESP